MSLNFHSSDLTWIDFIRYGLVEILGEDWVVTHPIENLTDVNEATLLLKACLHLPPMALPYGLVIACLLCFAASLPRRWVF